jgi:hypothetical protein
MLTLPGIIFLANLVQPFYERFFLSHPYSLKEAFKPLPITVTVGGEILILLLIVLSYISLSASVKRDSIKDAGFSQAEIKKINSAFIAFCATSLCILLLIAWNWMHPSEGSGVLPGKIADLFLYGATVSALTGFAFTLLVPSKWSLWALSVAGLMLAGFYGLVVRGLADPADIGFVIIGIMVFLVAGSFYNAAGWFLYQRPSTDLNRPLSVREKVVVALVILLGGALLFGWFRSAPHAPRQAHGLIVINLATYHPGTRISPVFTEKAYRITFWNRPFQRSPEALEPPAPVPAGPPSFRHRHPKDLPVKPPAAPLMAPAPLPSPDWNAMWMNSVKRTYTYVFRGRLTCGDHPCTDAQVHVALESTHNPDLQQVIRPTGDGAYEVRIPISEVVNESVKWTLSFAGTGVQAKELQGQAILMDNPTVTIENPPEPQP